MGLGLLMLVGYAVRPLLSVIRALLPDLLLLLPWPLLVGLGAATLGAVILLTTLVARRMARRTYDNNLKKS
ncbi:MAG: hypothetical protein COV99_11740 [Bacteroidetes bacterium CG12_big_fil_rev_8_21_14_0_65_60_17]|nr:MAG: hypothetical protein COV99_11740 [Bacteroidetes bacterium CG12_big_fil_rev_8_21_14_0_65_60_17]